MLLAPGAIQGQDFKLRREVCGLVQPVGNQAGRHHYHARAVQASGVFFAEDVSQGLQGLAQAHVVGQDAAHFQLAQRLHPAQAFELIGPQGRVEPLGDWR